MTTNVEANATMSAQQEKVVVKPILAGWLTTAEVAKLAGITISTIRGYNVRGSAGFPRPTTRSGAAPLWSIDTIVDWLRHRPQSRTEVAVENDGTLVVTQPSDYKERKSAGRITGAPEAAETPAPKVKSTGKTKVKATS